MEFNEDDVNRYLQPLFGQYEDSLQDAWIEILESNPKTTNEIATIARKVRNKAIRRYLEKKYREKSLHEPLRNSRDGRYTLESILENPSNDNVDEIDKGINGLYKKMVDFLIGEYFRQKTENLELKRKDLQLKAERLRLREESLRFKRDRFESWRKLMEEKGKQKERQIKLKIQIQREKLEFQREQALWSWEKSG